MVLGLDVGLKFVEVLSTRNLVRKFMGHYVSRVDLLGWMKMGW